MAILITGGAGFIGSAFVHSWFMHSDEPAVTLDLLTYAGNADNFTDLPATAAHTFVHGDIGDTLCLRCQRHGAALQITRVVHIRSIQHRCMPCFGDTSGIHQCIAIAFLERDRLNK